MSILAPPIPIIIDTIDESNINQISGDPTIFFRAGLSVDADGSPHAYHPDNIGLDWLANAGSDGNWYGIYAPDNIPHIQTSSDPAPGYYVSTTSLCDPGKLKSDPHRYVNSETIPYIAVPPQLIRSGLVNLCDFCMVVNTINGQMCGAIVADVGPSTHIGEGSIALAQKLGINADPKQGGVADGSIYIIFHNSHILCTFDPDLISDTAKQLYKAWDGDNKLKLYYPKLFNNQVNTQVNTLSSSNPRPLAVRSNKAPLSFGWACLKRMLALGWDLEHHEHRDRKGEYWIQWGIEDCTKLGIPLPNNFWQDEYNDRYCTGIWIPSKNSFTVTLNCPATVEPGLYYTTHPMNPLGAARLDNEVQFKAWRWGTHGTAKPYRAMCQAADLSYKRDLNMDGIRTGDKSYTTSGNYINLHHGWNSNTIDRNSAGCQVVKNIGDHNFRNQQADEYPHPIGDYFAYGILDGQKLATFWKSFF